MSPSLIDWSPPSAPPRETIAGHAARLEPLDTSLHGEALWSRFHGADDIWRFMHQGPFASRSEFIAWLAERERLADPLFFTIVGDTGGASGLLALMSIRPEAGVAEIGHVAFAPSLQRTRAATETIYLAARRIFELGYRRLEWKCDHRNIASMNAATRFGFRFEGVFRQHMVIKGQNRDTAWFSMLDREWPERRAAFEAWLSTENFDQYGRQKRRLSSFDAAGARLGPRADQ